MAKATTTTTTTTAKRAPRKATAGKATPRKRAPRKAPKADPTSGDLLAAMRQRGHDLLADPTATDLHVVAMAAGMVATRQVNSPWYRKGDGSGLWALCYSTAPGTGTRTQQAGVMWGLANSYATAVDDVASKAKSLRNGRDTLAAGSVFVAPAYVVRGSDVAAAKSLLRQAYADWVAALA